MSEKATYLEEQIAEKLQFWCKTVLLLAITLFPLLAIMDYIATPENFKRFSIYRTGITLILMFLYYLNTLKKNKNYQYAIIVALVILSAITIEAMILAFGAHASPYYAGINLLIIAALGFIPFSLTVSISVAILIYGIYIIPILLFDEITNPSYFITNNAFIISTFVIALTGRILSQKSMLNELSLQYDLAKDKNGLERYSTQLEELVAERTKELSISEQKYRELFSNANDGIAVLDKNGLIVNVNRKFCELHGFEKDALIGTHFGLLEVKDSNGEKEERVKRILNGEAIVYETEHYRKNGERILLEVSSKAIEISGELYIQSFHRDITEKKQMQEQLFQSQKMESIGALAGGIVHDFKNTLTAILGHTELLNECNSLNTDKSKQSLRIIENSARKAGQIVSKLLSFSRKDNFEVSPVNLNDIIRDTVELCGSMSGKRNIEIKVEAGNIAPYINADSNKLEQVLMNLFVNAMDAMPNGGRITVTTDFLDLEEKAVSRIHPLLKGEKYILLRVSDTGAGIPDNIKDKIFNPFFTTKEPGKGTGLGLAMVYGIVKEHKGAIDVKSTLGKGTTFEICLPALDTSREIAKTPAYPIIKEARILIVDDEEDILNFVKGTVEKQGYKTLITHDPLYALEIFGEVSDNIDLIITDISMPLLDGRRLINHIKEIKPTVKTIAISAHAENLTMGDKNIDAFISKPFEGVRLLSVIKKVLGMEKPHLKSISH